MLRWVFFKASTEARRPSSEVKEERIVDIRGELLLQFSNDCLLNWLVRRKQSFSYDLRGDPHGFIAPSIDGPLRKELEEFILAA